MNRMDDRFNEIVAWHKHNTHLNERDVALKLLLLPEWVLEQYGESYFTKEYLESKLK